MKITKNTCQVFVDLWILHGFVVNKTHSLYTHTRIIIDYGAYMKIGEKNVGTIDRAIRIILGLVLIGVFALNIVAAPWSYLVVLIGLIAIGTGVFGTCALYSLLGMNTTGKKA
jgi:hypothetical protein